MTPLLSSRFLGFASFCLGISLLVGCSGGATSNGSTITITVNYKGSPVPRAELTVYNKVSGDATPLNTREDGTCESKDLAPGEYDVTVATKVYTMGGGPSTPGAPKGDPRLAAKAAPAGGMSAEAKTKAADAAKANAITPPSGGVAIPAKYSKKETSKLTLTVVSGKNPPVTFALDD